MFYVSHILYHCVGPLLKSKKDNDILCKIQFGQMYDGEYLSIYFLKFWIYFYLNNLMDDNFIYNILLRL